MANLHYKMRDVSYLKPERYSDHMTLSEAAREVGVDPSWLRKLEADNRIPRAKRVKRGQLHVRMWSPTQVAEIKRIIANNKPGRPSG